MKKFAFISTNWIKKCYNFLLNKKKSNEYILDIIKISFIWICILLCLFFYFRNVSLASTQWYFYRQASNELTSAQFLYEIEKTTIMEKTQRNWNDMYSTNQTKNIIDVRMEYAQNANQEDKILSLNE
mgnify:CR=1 FL=1